jgi:nitrate reductase beta subunit
MRYLGVMLYDADKIHEAAAVENPNDLVESQLSIFLNPNDPVVQAAAREEGIPESWLEAAQKSPTYDMAVKWKIALPLHPEYRTLPMVWYVPPLSPLQGNAQANRDAHGDLLPDFDEGRIPVQYLANLLSAGNEAPVRHSLARLVALRRYSRAKMLGQEGTVPLPDTMTPEDAQAMYQLLAIANYEDRFVIPTSHSEYAKDSFGMEGPLGRSEVPNCSFSDGLGCEGTAPSLFGGFGAAKKAKP